jgi:hypothetical protein
VPQPSQSDRSQLQQTVSYSALNSSQPLNHPATDSNLQPRPVLASTSKHTASGTDLGHGARKLANDSSLTNPFRGQVMPTSPNLLSTATQGRHTGRFNSRDGQLSDAATASAFRTPSNATVSHHGQQTGPPPPQMPIGWKAVWNLQYEQWSVTFSSFTVQPFGL